MAHSPLDNELAGLTGDPLASDDLAGAEDIELDLPDKPAHDGKPGEVDLQHHADSKDSSGGKVNVHEHAPGHAPRLGLWEVFQLFLGFGLRAFGGPMAQIAMIKEHCVVKERWITPAHFNRVLGVYQILPGPEGALFDFFAVQPRYPCSRVLLSVRMAATELCCYFGYVTAGRMGAFIAGLGFILPGFLSMLLLSGLYLHYGVRSDYFDASFIAIQVRLSLRVDA